MGNSRITRSISKSRCLKNICKKTRRTQNKAIISPLQCNPYFLRKRYSNSTVNVKIPFSGKNSYCAHPPPSSGVNQVSSTNNNLNKSNEINTLINQENREKYDIEEEVFNEYTSTSPTTKRPHIQSFQQVLIKNKNVSKVHPEHSLNPKCTVIGKPMQNDSYLNLEQGPTNINSENLVLTPSSISEEFENCLTSETESGILRIKQEASFMKDELEKDLLKNLPTREENYCKKILNTRRKTYFYATETKNRPFATPAMLERDKQRSASNTYGCKLSKEIKQEPSRLCERIESDTSLRMTKQMSIADVEHNRSIMRLRSQKVPTTTTATIHYSSHVDTKQEIDQLPECDNTLSRNNSSKTINCHLNKSTEMDIKKEPRTVYESITDVKHNRSSMRLRSQKVPSTLYEFQMLPLHTPIKRESTVKHEGGTKQSGQFCSSELEKITTSSVTKLNVSAHSVTNIMHQIIMNDSYETVPLKRHFNKVNDQDNLRNISERKLSLRSYGVKSQDRLKNISERKLSLRSYGMTPKFNEIEMIPQNMEIKQESSFVIYEDITRLSPFKFSLENISQSSSDTSVQLSTQSSFSVIHDHINGNETLNSTKRKLRSFKRSHGVSPELNELEMTTLDIQLKQEPASLLEDTVRSSTLKFDSKNVISKSSSTTELNSSTQSANSFIHDGITRNEALNSTKCKLRSFKKVKELHRRRNVNRRQLSFSSLNEINCKKTIQITKPSKIRTLVVNPLSEHIRNELNGDVEKLDITNGKGVQLEHELDTKTDNSTSETSSEENVQEYNGIVGGLLNSTSQSVSPKIKVKGKSSSKHNTEKYKRNTRSIGVKSSSLKKQSRRANIRIVSHKSLNTSPIENNQYHSNMRQSEALLSHQTSDGIVKEASHDGMRNGNNTEDLIKDAIEQNTCVVDFLHTSSALNLNMNLGSEVLYDIDKLTDNFALISIWEDKISYTNDIYEFELNDISLDDLDVNGPNTIEVLEPLIPIINNCLVNNVVQNSAVNDLDVNGPNTVEVLEPLIPIINNCLVNNVVQNSVTKSVDESKEPENTSNIVGETNLTCSTGKIDSNVTTNNEHTETARSSSDHVITFPVDKERPTLFSSEKARVMFDTAVTINPVNLKAQVQFGAHVQKLRDEMGGASNLKQKDIKKKKIIDKKKEKLQWLKVEARMVELDALIKRHLQTEVDPEQCFPFLDELYNLNIEPLMLKKQPQVVETVQHLQQYVGNVSKWNGSQEEKLQFSLRAQQICTKAEKICNKFKDLFKIPKCSTFSQLFADNVTKFSKKTRKFSRNGLLSLVADP